MKPLPSPTFSELLLVHGALPIPFVACCPTIMADPRGGVTTAPASTSSAAVQRLAGRHGAAGGDGDGGGHLGAALGGAAGAEEAPADPADHEDLLAGGPPARGGRGARQATGTDSAGRPSGRTVTSRARTSSPEGSARSSAGRLRRADEDGQVGPGSGNEGAGHGCLRRCGERTWRGKDPDRRPGGVTGPALSQRARSAGLDVAELGVGGGDDAEQLPGLGDVAGPLVQVGQRVGDAQVVLLGSLGRAAWTRSSTAMASSSRPWSASEPA